VKDLYNENYKRNKLKMTLEDGKTSQDGKTSHVHGLTELIL
jgi:hypothetical protein